MSKEVRSNAIKPPLNWGLVFIDATKSSLASIAFYLSVALSLYSCTGYFRPLISVRNRFDCLQCPSLRAPPQSFSRVCFLKRKLTFEQIKFDSSNIVKLFCKRIYLYLYLFVLVFNETISTNNFLYKLHLHFCGYIAFTHSSPFYVQVVFPF